MFKEAGYAVDVATLGGIAPTVDKSSLDPDFMKWVRPFMQIDDAAAAAKHRKTIEQQEACAPEGCRPADQGRHRIL